MNLESYHATDVISPLWAKRFYSEGSKGKFEKLILYSDIPENFPLVNLGFGDRIGDSLDFDDKVETKNGDGEKILATVVQTIPEFFKRFPDRILFVQGSTPSRNFVYRKIVRDYQKILRTNLQF